MNKQAIVSVFVIVTTVLLVLSISSGKNDGHSMDASADPTAITDSVILQDISLTDNPYTLAYQQSKLLSLLDVHFSQPDYTQVELDSGWHRTATAPEIDTLVFSDSTVTITVVGNISGGQPLNGRIEISNDTLYLLYWKEEKYKPYLSYRKSQLIYTIAPRENFENPAIVTKNIGRPL